MIRIENIDLFPGVMQQSAFPVIKDAVALIEKGVFSYVGPKEQAPNLNADTVVDGLGQLLIPALVNAHTHSAMTLMRGLGADLPLADWLQTAIFPMERRLTAKDALAGVQLAMLEYLRCGVTTFNDMYMFPEETARAVGDGGMRAMITNACVDFGKGEQQLQEALHFFRDFHQAFDGRVRASISLHSEYTTTKPLAKKLIQSTEGLDNRMHIHISETTQEVIECQKRHGKTPIAYFYELGLFKTPTIAAHCVAVTEEDLNILAKEGVCVSHNPISNLKLGSGVAPVPKMLKKGISLALGTDGAGSNDNLNLFEEMKLAGILHKGVAKDATLVGPEVVFESATISGAKAMGFERLGLLLKGWQADCVLIDQKADNLVPCDIIPQNLVYAAQNGNVLMTMCAGEILYQNGQYKTLDEERIKHQAILASKRLKEEA